MKAWITHTIEDNEIVDKLKASLSEAQIEYIDVANEIMPGDNIVESIYQAISSADIIFVILSKASNDRQWFSTEIGLIISEIRNNPNKKVIPILVDKHITPPPFINQYQYLDLTNKEVIDNQIIKLIDVLKTKERKVYSNKNIDDISHRLFLTKEELLRKEKEEYEKQKKQKQRILSVTLVTTLTFATFSIGLFTLIGEYSLFKDINTNTFSSLLIGMIGLLAGVIVSLLFERLKNK